MADKGAPAEKDPGDEVIRDEPPDPAPWAPRETPEQVQEELEDEDRFQATDN